MDIAHNAHSINFLVKSLLTLSMLDSGTVELKFGDVSVEKSLTSAFHAQRFLPISVM